MRPGVANVIAGAGLAGALTALIMAAAMFTGIISDASTFVFVGGALGGILFGTLGENDGWRAQIVGAGVVGIVAALSGRIGEFGLLEIAGIASFAVIAMTARSGVWRRLGLPSWWWVPVVGLTIVMIVPSILEGGVLGHDESAYALKAKTWLYDTPGTGWGLHRGIGMSVYAIPVLAWGGAEPGLRALGLVSLGLLAVGAWLLGRRMGSLRVGGVAAVAVLASPAMLKRATEYLSDIPSAALLMLVMLIVWRQFGEREVPGYGLAALIPVALAAFYLRHQSILSFTLIAAVIAGLWWRKVVARPGPVIASAAIGLAGLVPHFMFAMTATGSPLGVLTYTATSGGRDFTGDGIVGYAAMFGWALALFIGPVLMLLAGRWLVASWSDIEQRTKAMFLLVPAVGQVLILGIVGDAHYRFVFFPFALLCVAGALGLAEQTWEARTGLKRAALVGGFVLLAGTLALSMASSRRWVEYRSLRNEPLILAAEEIRRDSSGADCGVMTSYLPQITFYSECATDAYRTTMEPEAAVERLRGEFTYMVLLEDGKEQPDGEYLRDLVDETSEGPSRIEGESFWADLFRFEP